MSGANVFIHQTQFPQNVHRELLRSLRRGEINHKFHYANYKQAQQWLALHNTWSPASTDADCRRIYDAAFELVKQREAAHRVQVIGLGCGGGEKEKRLIARLGGRCVNYVPCDVSVPLVLVAKAAVEKLVPAKRIQPVVADLALVKDFSTLLPHRAARRIITFFGMIPNFEPATILPRLPFLLRASDRLLFSANLAPGADYASGVRRVLPQYDNALTRDWLMTFLFDIGVEPGDGELRFGIENVSGAVPLLRIVARYLFLRSRSVRVQGEEITFRKGRSIRLFFSYRHTPATIQSLLMRHGIAVMNTWINESGEEGVFLCRKDTRRR